MATIKTHHILQIVAFGLQYNLLQKKGSAMKSHGVELLKKLAGKYIWWKTPDESIAMPERVVAQVMNIGDYDDIQALAHQVGDDHLRAVLALAESGQFSIRSWTYWHYRLGLAAPGQVPPLPIRRFG